MAMTYKGSGPVDAKYAHGGPPIPTTMSRFYKTPDTFTTSIQEQDYEKTGKGGPMSKLSGETKAEKPVKPRT